MSVEKFYFILFQRLQALEVCDAFLDSHGAVGFGGAVEGGANVED